MGRLKHAPKEVLTISRMVSDCEAQGVLLQKGRGGGGSEAEGRRVGWWKGEKGVWDAGGEVYVGEGKEIC